MNRMAKYLLATMLALIAQPAALAAGLDHEDFTDAFSRDVFVIDGSTLRNPTSDTADDEPLYNNAGVSLELTWGAWRAVSGTSVVAHIGGPTRPRSDVRMQADGLVPNGVYSVVFFTFGPESRHPVCSDLDRFVPVTSLHGERQEPDASSFMADVSGRGGFHGRVDGALLDADSVGFILVYHFDGNSYHPFTNAGQVISDCLRNSYGEDAFRHLFVQQKGIDG